jgi:DNA-binding LytR/AlgR family response regulator
MKIAILEDERLNASQLQTMLHAYDPAIEVAAIIPSVAKAITWFPEHTDLDLILMDIHLEDTLAFRIFEQIEVTIPVIFTTAYDEYILQAFKVNGIDYLLKPIQPTHLHAALEKYKTLDRHFVRSKQKALAAALEKISSQHYKDRFMISVGTKIQSIPIHEIAYFYLENKIVYLVNVQAKKLPVSYSLEALEQSIDPKLFFRVNRQYFVAHSSIRNMNLYSPGKLRVELQPPATEEVFVSGDRLTNFKEWLGK